jgi:hypothetical protein
MGGRILGSMGCCDHALPMRVVTLRDVQRLVGVNPILATNRDELYEKCPQRLEYHEIVQ